MKLRRLYFQSLIMNLKLNTGNNKQIHNSLNAFGKHQGNNYYKRILLKYILYIHSMILNITCYKFCCCLFLYPLQYSNFYVSFDIPYHQYLQSRMRQSMVSWRTIKYLLNIDSVSSFMPGTVKKAISIKQSLKKFTIFLERKRYI